MNLKTIFFPPLVVLIFLCSCENVEEKSERLAKRHCSTCHIFADPSLLDKKTWESGVFPEMAFRMGLDVTRLSSVNEFDLNEILKTLPGRQLVSDEEWKVIREYYVNNAPDTLRIVNEREFLPLQQFTASTFSLHINSSTLLTMIKYDEANKRFFIGTRNSQLFKLDQSLALEDSFQLESPPSDILLQITEKPILSCMGIMDPNDQAVGTIVQLASSEEDPVTLIDSLKRPVDLQQADLNNDKQDDLVVSAFGNFTGGLLVYEKDDGKYHPHLIHNFPGTRNTIIRDFNDDGLPDIMALITQGDEQIALFTNRGDFRFSFRILLKFPPVYGSSYFDLYDFNKDGNLDILYTNGDNADFSTVLKPYHGVRILLNDGKNSFTESWFYSMHGASMACAADFDEDGDLDIAAISFFPDFKKHPEHSFIYFENDQGKFTPYLTTLASASRWITLESADIDNDQDLDLLLGSLTFARGVPDSLFQVWKGNQASLLILKNNLR